MTPTARRLSWTLVGAGGAAFVLLAWWLVPWDPVPGGPVEPVRAEDYFSVAHLARAEEYSRWARVLSYSSLAVSLAVACYLGLSRRGRAWARRAPGPWWVQVVVLVAAVELARRLVTLPFGIAFEQRRRDYGLSTRSWAGYAADLVRNEVLGIGVASIALLVVIGLARWLPRAWPAVAGLLVAALVVLGSFVYPVVVEPAFNSFEPLADGPLRQGIEELADAEGVEIGDVLVADASRRTSTLNAYVSGFGASRRVVLYDTLVEDLPVDQALSVVAHELAHAKHDDVVVGTVLGAASAVAGVGLLALCLGWFGRRGWPAVSEAAVAPLALALFAVGGFLASPVQNGISRQVETRADVDALRVTRDPDAFVGLQVRLAEKSLADPTPPGLAHWWFGSHPGVLDRFGRAR
ncbi:M48 family metalloprotease [Nocardioides sp. zg-579]|uniref:M48 family metalloprotease n=1 Tax=Nocardioides marmotae TaxID=2663857 RepID=A0A6I3JBK9_9ACTN|nr:M48 family metallopeptidase [Nocardioides marmotae]MCR6031902.1 M48 family metalloprotease [Gordonia jinghuaiqii]MTB95542.1 M48 family metalloprotease [Nocardioides marmotae]QKE00966.1 M48 family metallopeptidase [Nocardioides marmotae]